MELRVLLVEDEALIALMAQDMIEGLDHRVVQTAATVSDALAACTECEFDCALLDVNLNGDSSMAIATALKARGIPFAFTTGYGAGGVDDAHRDVSVLGKPYSLTDLGTLLGQFAAQLAGTSSTMSSVDSNRG
ncbi:MAG: response regulator [Sphingomonadales bacterium]